MQQIWTSLNPIWLSIIESKSTRLRIANLQKSKRKTKTIQVAMVKARATTTEKKREKVTLQLAPPRAFVWTKVVKEKAKTTTVAIVPIVPVVLIVSHLH